ncbi:MAG: hypothetical protein NVSMB28_12150 [Collimonas sp.]
MLDNAIHYTPAGGKIVLRLRRDNTALRAILEVEDSGIGIAEEVRERVFSAFYRAPGLKVTISFPLPLSLNRGDWL